MNFQDGIVYDIIDARGKSELGAGAGVSWDVYSLFWAEVSDSYMVGAEQRIPFVRHDLYTSEWEAIAKILVKILP